MVLEGFQNLIFRGSRTGCESDLDLEPQGWWVGLSSTLAGLGSTVLGLGFEVLGLPYDTFAPWRV